MLALAGRINATWAEMDHAPMLCVNRNYARAELAGIYRAARIGLVTPLRDGMNLVAKEYVAAQDPDDPGVLILSRFAGAAEQMTDALIVNPYSPRGAGRRDRRWRSRCRGMNACVGGRGSWRGSSGSTCGPGATLSWPRWPAPAIAARRRPSGR